MRLRSALVAGLAATALLSINADAAPGFSFDDTAGDANGINDQTDAGTAGNTATGPVSRGAADIVKVDVARAGTKKKPTGIIVTVTLGGTPDVGILYRFRASTADCRSIWPSYFRGADGSKTTNMRVICGDSDETVTIPAAVEKEKTITFTIPLKSLPKSAKVGSELSGVSFTTRFVANSSSATAPSYDFAKTDLAYKIGS